MIRVAKGMQIETASEIRAFVEQHADLHREIAPLLVREPFVWATQQDPQVGPISDGERLCVWKGSDQWRPPTGWRIKWARWVRKQAREARKCQRS